MHTIICAILAATLQWFPSDTNAVEKCEGIEGGMYESTYPAVKATTNVVVCLQITKEYVEPCPCPDGLEGCCVTHYKHVNKTTFTPVKHLSKHLDAKRGIGIKIPILKECLLYADEYDAEIVPIRAVNRKGHIVFDDEPVGWFLLSKAKKFVQSEENRISEYKVESEFIIEED